MTPEFERITARLADERRLKEIAAELEALHKERIEIHARHQRAVTAPMRDRVAARTARVESVVRSREARMRNRDPNPEHPACRERD